MLDLTAWLAEHGVKHDPLKLTLEFPDWLTTVDFGQALHSEIAQFLTHKDERPNPNFMIGGVEIACSVAPDDSIMVERVARAIAPELWNTRAEAMEKKSLWGRELNILRDNTRTAARAAIAEISNPRG